MLTFVNILNSKKAIFICEIFFIYMSEFIETRREFMTRIVDTRQVAQNTYDYNTFQTGVQSGTINTNDITNVSVFSESQNPSECTDGKDDGKLGFFETIGS